MHNCTDPHISFFTAANGFLTAAYSAGPLFQGQPRYQRLPCPSGLVINYDDTRVKAYLKPRLLQQMWLLFTLNDMKAVYFH